MIGAILFDWGNTVMVDFGFPGPMYTWNKVAWVSGAENALKTLSGKYLCCLATNAGASTTPEVLLALKRVGAEKYFKHIFLAKEIGFKKPDERFFRAIIDHLGLAPSSMVMIGDHYQKDCPGAKQAGLKTVFLNADHENGPFPMADAVIGNLDELVNTIDKL
jgi:HAD superfamily hydrolase (TIGR01509 family)